MANVLSQLLEELNSGRLKIVDLTTPLGPDTPVIDLPAGGGLLVGTGGSKFTGREVFLNESHARGFPPTCSAFLAKERKILGVGVKTVGTDAGQAGGFDPPFPSHTFMHGAGKFGITSLVNLELLPPIGAIVIAAPLKIVNGSGSPLRVIAITP